MALQKQGCKYVSLKKDELRPYGLTTKQVLQPILVNENFQFSSMSDILHIPENPDFLPLYVLTNQDCICGASMICNPIALSYLAQTFSDALYILPSSIHECILIPVSACGNITPQELLTIVTEVNREQVEPAEQLKEHIYLLDAKQKCFHTLL